MIRLKPNRGRLVVLFSEHLERYVRDTVSMMGTPRVWVSGNTVHNQGSWACYDLDLKTRNINYESVLSATLDFLRSKWTISPYTQYTSFEEADGYYFEEKK